MSSGIYCIKNLINSKCYIGKAYNVEIRLKEHRRSHHSAILLQRAVTKYGIDNFEFSILEECSKDELSNREIYWIRELNSLNPNGYNIATGGNGGDTISNLPEEKYESYIKKLSNPRREGFSEEQSLRFKGSKNPMYGKHFSEESKNKLSNSISGSRNPVYGCNLMNNGIIQKYIKREDQNSYINNGWTYGKLKLASSETIESRSIEEKSIVISK